MRHRTRMTRMRQVIADKTGKHRDAPKIHKPQSRSGVNLTPHGFPIDGPGTAGRAYLRSSSPVQLSRSASGPEPGPTGRLSRRARHISRARVECDAGRVAARPG